MSLSPDQITGLLDAKYKDKEGNPIKQVWYTRGDVLAIIRATETTLQAQALDGRPHNTEPMVTP